MIQAVVYTSNAGSTAQYAQMLGEKTGLPVYSLDAARKACSDGAEIIYLGWVMADGIQGYRVAAKRFCVRALCAVGLNETGYRRAEVRRKNLLPEDMPLFTLQGGFDLGKLRGVHHFMMRIMIGPLGRQLSERADRTAGEEKMLQMLLHGGSGVCMENLRGVLDWWAEAEDLENRSNR